MVLRRADRLALHDAVGAYKRGQVCFRHICRKRDLTPFMLPSEYGLAWPRLKLRFLPVEPARGVRLFRVRSLTSKRSLMSGKPTWGVERSSTACPRQWQKRPLAIKPKLVTSKLGLRVRVQSTGRQLKPGKRGAILKNAAPILDRLHRADGDSFRPTYKPEAPASACSSVHVAKAERTRWRFGLVRKGPDRGDVGRFGPERQDAE